MNSHRILRMDFFDEAEKAREILKDLDLSIFGINLKENKDENEKE